MIYSEIYPTAKSFLQQQKKADPTTLFRDYAHYLLDTSNSKKLPVPLHEVRHHHDFRRNVNPLSQRGFLVDDVIFVNSDDPSTVQRFTEAHEMMESLVIALRSENLSSLSSNTRKTFEKDKERWCEQGAAELLMPRDLFLPRVLEKGVGIDVARNLASLCQTSLTATLRKMLEMDTGSFIFAMLQEGHKKVEYIPSKVGQRVLWGEPTDWDPPAELRVWRRWASPQVDKYMCFNESFSRDSLVYKSLASETTGIIECGYDHLDLEYIKGTYYTESLLVNVNGRPTVMALIHL